MQEQMKRICVFCGSSAGNHPAYRDAAGTLSDALLENRLGLVYGGAKVGLMGELADRMLAKGGRVTGVIPRFLKDREVAHEGLTRLVEVNTMHERKQAMEEESDGFIALPGGLGTLEEIFEVITWGQLGLHRKPCGFLNVKGYFDSIHRFFANAVKEGFIQEEMAANILFETDARTLLRRFCTFTPREADKAAYALNDQKMNHRKS